MAEVHMPRDEAELSGLVRAAHAERRRLEVCGFRSKRAAGREDGLPEVVSVSKLSGITLYEPGELVISARAGTPLHEVETLLAEHNQELAFEPADIGRIYNAEPVAASLGGMFAMNISGPRRILRGAARDYALGLRAVNGLGEVIKAGGRVMKNVTGVDLVRGLAGSWGTLAVVTELTFKVMPRAPECRTVLFFGLSDEAAAGVMSAAMGTPYEVSGTVHLHAPLVKKLKDPGLGPENAALTALRLEGTPQSLVYRLERIRRELAPFGETYELQPPRSAPFWSDIRSCAFLTGDNEKILWRIVAQPSKAPLIVRALSAFFPVTAAYEWSGGLVWLELPPASDGSVTEVRRVLAEFSADAMLMRAPRGARSSIEVFQPLPFAKMSLVRSLKTAFDPGGVLNAGRMYATV